MNKSKIIGIVHGRFQPFHLGHLDYVKSAKLQCDFLYIGIANPDPSLTSLHSADIKRSKIQSNPFTYYERLAMIKATLISEGININDFEIVPFPINFPQYIRYYVPIDAIFFMTIYDDWGYAKKTILEKENLNVVVLQEGTKKLKLAEGTKIRTLILQNDNWKKFVPNAVADYIISNQLIESRIL